MKKARIIFAAALLFLLLCTACQGAGQNTIHVVESVPLETELGSPKFLDTQAAWVKAMSEAKKSIDIEVFYICSEKGQPMERIIAAIEGAAARGVQVRIIVDSKFYKTYPEPAATLGKKKNVTVRVIDFGRLAGGVMHAKFFVVDARTVFVGSQNFDWRAISQIHEIGLLIRDARIAQEFAAIFEMDWRLCLGGKASPGPVVKGPPARPGQSRLIYDGEECLAHAAFSPPSLVPKGMALEEDEIVKLMDGAKKEILIQVMHYSPRPRNKKDGYYAVLDNGLRRAALRGAKVKMTVADWSLDRETVPYLKSLACIPNVEIRVSHIPQHSRGHIPFARVEHCKYMLVDGDKTWVGTGNWQKGYFHDSRDAGVVITGKGVNRDMREMFFRGWNSKYVEPVDVAKDYRAGAR
jgi:phosphatidylserine/phosphatidylglycerophosphate/cardiolipin synthase-like enzyme